MRRQDSDARDPVSNDLQKHQLLNSPHPSTLRTWRSLWKATGLELAVFQVWGL